MHPRSGLCDNRTMPLAPPVGVVIANHNNAAYVGKAIDSAAGQTVQGIEVVVVDDASTDGSDEAIRGCLARLDDRRFRYVKLDRNVGQGGAMRRGMAELDTPFVCFLDSDDVWYEDFVARHLAVHLNADFPVAVTYCDSHIIDAEGRLLAGTAWWFDSDQLHIKTPRPVDAAMAPGLDPATGALGYGPRPGACLTLYPHWTPASATNTTASMMFRRSFVDLVMVPSDDALQLYVDFYLSTFAYLLTGAIAIHQALYAYRMHGANKHSDAAVPGGAYNSSSRDWGPIRAKLLAMIQAVLRDQGDPLRRAFGEERCAIADAALAAALRPPAGWAKILAPWRRGR